jgi:hypothetical protein
MVPFRCPCRSAYIAAATLMASRAFYVGPTHGDALCPACDLFNHKAALVPDNMEGVLHDGIFDGGASARGGRGSIAPERSSEGSSSDSDDGEADEGATGGGGPRSLRSLSGR